jgi:hypothetical protein
MEFDVALYRHSFSEEITSDCSPKITGGVVSGRADLAL